MRLFVKRRYKSQRTALSLVEFLGCFAAMSGGIILGSMYLGIDLAKAATLWLERTELIDKSYFADAAEPEKYADDPQVEPTQENINEQSEVIDGEVTPTEEKVSEVGESSDEAESAGVATSLAIPEPTPEERLHATQNYWNKLTECMRTEALARVQDVDNPAQWQLYDYLTLRKKGHQQAVDSLETIDSFAVDSRLLEHGRQVLTWHKSGVKLFEHALSLLTDGPGAKISGPFAQSWQSAATQLRMEENLVIERHKGVANYLDREFSEGGPFPPAF